MTNPLPYPVPPRSLACTALMSFYSHFILPLFARCDGRFDELSPQGLALVVRTNNFSISHLQRHFHLGYRRACRMMSAIEATGIVKREILSNK